MFDLNAGTLLLGLLAIGGWIVVLLIVATHWDYKKQLKFTLESLRDNLNQAKSLVEQHPDNKAARATYERALKLYELVENGIETRRHPLAILRAVASEVGVEMAISARFEAGARK